MALPEQPGVGAVGFYFQPGNLGLLLYPAVSLYAIQFPSVTQDEFVAQVRAKYGIRLRAYGRLDPA
jgi:hypothetical protein